jgi:hypothetical protein
LPPGSSHFQPPTGIFRFEGAPRKIGIKRTNSCAFGSLAPRIMIGLIVADQPIRPAFILDRT